MIPNTIHYCWFGNQPLSKTAQKCIATWHTHLPGAELKLWNESNSPMHHPFVQAAYSAKKFAFVADYVRLYALYSEGGIYLDTDMYVVKDFDNLRSHDSFIGKEDEQTLSCGIIGCEKNNAFIGKCLLFYDTLKFDIQNLKEISIPKNINRVFNGLPGFEKEKITIYSTDYFYPYPYIERINGNSRFSQFRKPETIAIHLWDASWMPEIEEYANIQRSFRVRMLKLAFKIKDIISK